ncbi:MAG: hypothetical protein AVO39_11735 [delta proteobacterium MLS_D]|nr:MAG: hypothetical protein AVO39_11735 [delta proteobacterium MLS_D]
MDTLTNETSEKSNPATLPATNNVTFLQALADGRTHLGWLDGQTTGQCGREAALASRFPLPANAKDLMTNGTYGPLGLA